MKLFGFILALFALPAAAEPADAPLAAALGVQIQKPAGDNLHFSQGSGVFLGGGLVLTAAHVVKVNPQDPAATVIMDGWQTAAKVAAIAPNGLDLALLKIDPSEISAQRRNLTPVKLCVDPLTASQSVIVASQGQVSYSVAVPNEAAGNGTYLLNTAYPHGASGGGVFDPSKGCLMGIIVIRATGKVDGSDVALSEFLNVKQIAPFLAANLH